MVLRSPCGVLLLAFLCKGPIGEATAQTARPERTPTPISTPTNQPERSPTLHDAWLFEVLDLDIKKAVAAYEKVAADQRPGNLDRWVAVARLAELKRLGVDVTLQVDQREVPEPLRAPLANISAPLPVADLLQRIHGAPAEVLQYIGTEAGRLPPLHPVTALAEDWRLAQIPSNREQNNRRAGANLNSDLVNQFNAIDIVRTELGGWRSQAAVRRAMWFPNWQPPKLSGDSQPYLEKVRTNLEAWLRDTEQAQLRNALRELQSALNEKAADPAASLALIARLPIFAEKLLGLPAPASR